MKQLIILLALLPTFGFGQKIDLDHSTTYTNLINLPSLVLAPEVSKYAFQKTGIHNVTSWGFDEEQIISQYSNLQGFKKVAPEEADLIWTVNINPIQFNGIDIKSSSSTTKDKAGREITTYSYWYEMYYFKHFNAQVLNRKSEVIFSYSDNNQGDRLVSKGETKSTYKEAEEIYNKEGKQVQANIARKHIEAELKFILSCVNEKLGYQSEKVSFNLYTTDSPKHPENEAFIKNLKETQRLFKNIPAQSLPKSIVDDLEKAVKYFESVATKYTSKEKVDIKLRYASYYNIAQIYQYLDRFDESTEAAKKLIANDYDKKDGEKIIKANVSLKEELAKAGQKSRRFDHLHQATTAQEPIAEQPNSSPKQN
jgi:hypothetical protein